MTLQDILNFRKDNKTLLSTTHTMTIAEYKAMALELLTKFKEYEVKVDQIVKNRIHLKVFR